MGGGIKGSGLICWATTLALKSVFYIPYFQDWWYNLWYSEPFLEGTQNISFSSIQICNAYDPDKTMILKRVVLSKDGIVHMLLFRFTPDPNNMTVMTVCFQFQRPPPLRVRMPGTLYRVGRRQEVPQYCHVSNQWDTKEVVWFVQPSKRLTDWGVKIKNDWLKVWLRILLKLSFYRNDKPGHGCLPRIKVWLNWVF